MRNLVLEGLRHWKLIVCAGLIPARRSIKTAERTADHGREAENL